MTTESKFSINYVSLIALDISNFSGKQSSVLPLFVEMNIQEDLFLPAHYGTITLVDNINFYEKFPIIGEEVLTVTYKDFVHGPVTKKFFIYGVKSRHSAGDKGQMYTLNFCSEEILANKSTRYSKSYTGKQAHIIAEEAFSRLGSLKKINVTSTIGLQDYIVPNLNPFDVIQQMAARSITSKGEAGSVIFYEDKDGFNFSSLETLIQEEPTKMYIGDGSTVSLDKKFFIFNNFKFIEPVNKLNNALEGTHGVALRTIDLFNRKFTDNNSYDYFNDGDYTKINRVNTSNPDLRLSSNNYPYKSNVGLYKVSVVSPGSTKNEVLTKRYNVLSSYKNGPKIHAEIPFNTDITVGKMVDVNILTSDITSATRNVPGNHDKFFNGNYIITACRHVVKPGSAITVIELSKDSYTQSYQQE